MSDATQPRPTSPFPAEGAALLPPHVDPLAGDWSEGLRGPVRALGIVEPRLLQLDGSVQPIPESRAASELPPLAPVAEVEAPDAWGVSSDGDPLQSAPPPQSEPPSVIITFTDPPVTAPPAAAMPDVTPSSPAPAFLADVTPASPAPAFESAPPEPAAVSKPAPADEGVLELRAEDAADAASHDGIVELRAEDAAEASSAGPAPAEAAAPTTDASAHATDSQAWASAIAAAPGTPSGPTPWSEAMAPHAPPPAAEPWKEAPVAMPGPQPEGAASWDQVTAVNVPAPVLVPPAPAGWDMHPPAAPAPASADDAWSAPPPAPDPAAEWKAEAPAGDWQEIKRPSENVAAAQPADWGSLSRGPDWSSEPPPQASTAEDAWGSAPPPAEASAWTAAPAPAEERSWEAPATPAQEEWSTPPPNPVAASAWSAAPAGASALEQLDSDPPEPEPGAAAELFGSVPVGASLSGDDDELGPPEELASPEEVLKPVEMADEDADLLVPVEEEAPPRQPPPQPLAAMQPVAVGALGVQGEHRVAVHTRGGRTRRGVVRDIDLGKSQFPLVPQGGGAAEPVYHAEVKAIFFMLAPGEKLQPADGGKVRVTFADGRTIEGHRDGPEAKHGFFLVPADASRTNTRRIYVAREATTDIKNG